MGMLHPQNFLNVLVGKLIELNKEAEITGQQSVKVKPSSRGAFMVKAAVAGTAPYTFNAARNTIADAGTVAVSEHRAMVLYQDASGGAVTMTSATGTALDAEFPDMGVGDTLPQFLASNHATNTSTISGGTGVTLVGSGAVINTGGSFLLIKTGTATYDLVRVG